MLSDKEDKDKEGLPALTLTAIVSSPYLAYLYLLILSLSCPYHPILCLSLDNHGY